MKKISLFVVDDHQLVREMCSFMFAQSETIEVVGESGLLEEAIELIWTKRPNIVLLDINLAQASGFDAVPLIQKYSPGTRIIAVSMHTQPAYVKRMMQLGASGYVTKNSSRQEMIRAIDEVIQNKKYICAEIKNNLTEQMFSNEEQVPDIHSLSYRELEVIKHIQQGHSSKEIAAALNISVKTVEVHRYNILKKLNQRNTAALISYIHGNYAAHHLVNP